MTKRSDQSSISHSGSSKIVFYVSKSQATIPVIFYSQVIMGRAAASIGQISDVVYLDLSAEGAFEYGVSRRHLMLAIDNNYRPVAFDLNSYNGSFLNGVRMSPDISYPLNSGDTLKLGALELKIKSIDIVYDDQCADDRVEVDVSEATVVQMQKYAPRQTMNLPSTRALNLPDPKPDIRNTLGMRPINMNDRSASRNQQNEQRA